MKKIHFYLGIGINNADREEVVEFEDNATDEEIGDEYEDWKNNYIDASWWKEEE